MIVTARKHAEALALIASLETQVSEIRTRLEMLAEATGHVYVPQRRHSVPPACYAPKDSDLAKEYKSFQEKSVNARQQFQGRSIYFSDGWCS